MDEQHHRLIRIALDALADDYGYALAGGYAIQAHHIVQRVSEDVDLFAPVARARQEMPEATTRVATAYEAAGYSVDVAQQVETYTRLTVTDPATGTRTKVELVAEFLHHPPVDSDLGPVLHPDDLAAGKTSALFSRAEVRDAIDVDGLIKAGYTRARLMELAAENDAGFDQRHVRRLPRPRPALHRQAIRRIPPHPRRSRRHPPDFRHLAARTGPAPFPGERGDRHPHEHRQPPLPQHPRRAHLEPRSTHRRPTASTTPPPRAALTREMTPEQCGRSPTGHDESDFGPAQRTREARVGATSEPDATCQPLAGPVPFGNSSLLVRPRICTR
nr:nucleotidyl transferase AbiEii/AbiGii toxin family protein [Streptomyces sp. NBC_00899]